MILNDGEKTLLRLIGEKSEKDGWTPVSALIFPAVEKMPKDLIEFERVGDEGQGRARLTIKGDYIFAWL